MSDKYIQEAHNPELICDFLDEFEDTQPGDTDLLNDLFRNMRSVKSSLRMMPLNIYSDRAHALENVLDPGLCRGARRRVGG